MVGGGDGGVLREVGKHPMVEEIHLCDLDEVTVHLLGIVMSYLIFEMCKLIICNSYTVEPGYNGDPLQEVHSAGAIS